MLVRNSKTLSVVSPHKGKTEKAASSTEVIGFGGKLSEKRFEGLDAVFFFESQEALNDIEVNPLNDTKTDPP